jgi:hypothetical protein
MPFLKYLMEWSLGLAVDFPCPNRDAARPAGRREDSATYTVGSSVSRKILVSVNTTGNEYHPGTFGRGAMPRSQHGTCQNLTADLAGISMQRVKIEI